MRGSWLDRVLVYAIVFAAVLLVVRFARQDDEPQTASAPVETSSVPGTGDLAAEPAEPEFAPAPRSRYCRELEKHPRLLFPGQDTMSARWRRDAARTVAAAPKLVKNDWRLVTLFPAVVQRAAEIAGVSVDDVSAHVDRFNTAPRQDKRRIEPAVVKAFAEVVWPQLDGTKNMPFALTDIDFLQVVVVSLKSQRSVNVYTQQVCSLRLVP